jgi:hypothetical protein
MTWRKITDATGKEVDPRWVLHNVNFCLIQNVEKDTLEKKKA